jgi:hypothetical protein
MVGRRYSEVLTELSADPGAASNGEAIVPLNVDSRNCPARTDPLTSTMTNADDHAVV